MSNFCDILEKPFAGSQQFDSGDTLHGSADMPHDLGDTLGDSASLGDSSDAPDDSCQHSDKRPGKSNDYWLRLCLPEQSL